jgi:hypothetical protein
VEEQACRKTKILHACLLNSCSNSEMCSNLIYVLRENHQTCIPGLQ